jgi:hypothetical protein
MMDHYADLRRRAASSFDPVHDWEEYHRGNITDESFWGTNYDSGISFLNRLEEHGPPLQLSTKGSHTDKLLLTHSGSPQAVHKMLIQNEIGGINTTRVCLSAGRVVEVRKHNYAFVFPRSVIEGTYDVFPYCESWCSHENEIRSVESMHPGLAIAFVPVTPEVFPNIQGQHNNIVARGKEPLIDGKQI